jgi:hypothetical protein
VKDLFAAGVNYIKLVELAPPKVRPELEKIFREHKDYDFDAERFYRESEAAVEERDNDFQKALAALEVDGPEHMTAQLKKRIRASDSESLKAWRRELTHPETG